MATRRIILSPLVMIAAMAAVAGCHHLDGGQQLPPPCPAPYGAQGCPPEQVVVIPEYGQPSPVVEYWAPGQAPTGPATPWSPGMIPAFPGAAPPLAVAPPPPEPLPGWFDVLPDGADAISPDFGLPRQPVVTNRLPNPLSIPVTNREWAWDQLADVMSDYFPIASEQPVQLVSGVLTPGYLETPFQTGSTVLEPQRNDSVGSFNRWQSTLQTIRRRAILTVTPDGQGFAIQAVVQKQLEDLPHPEDASAGVASLRSDNSLPSQRREPVSRIRTSKRWIDLGRDEPLEQELLRRLQERLAPKPQQ